VIGVTGRLVARRPETWRGDAVFLEVPAEALAAHTRPGQYCRIHADGRTGHFAIVSAPGPGPLEFYVQRDGAASEALLALPIGAEVALSLPEGPGFALDDALAAGGPLFVVATGSGLAAMRGLLDAVGTAGRTATVYAGCRQPGDFVYAPDLVRWQAAGFDVHLTVSRWSGPGWSGRRGYVQDALAADAPDLAHAWIFLCGVPEMLRAVRDACARLGADPERIRTNL
jgi:CDP-4-dehydro-6-deoxyglucose reductase